MRSPIRWLLVALALAELAAALVLQAQPADSPTATANALGIVALAVCVWALVRHSVRLRGSTRHSALLVGLWLVLGLLRAIPLVSGRPGWLLNQSLTVGGQAVSSQTVLRDVDFQAGSAPAHLINDWAIFDSSGTADRSHVPLTIQAVAYVRGRGELTVASSAPVTVRLGTRALFDSSPPPGAPPGTVLTPNGPKSLDDIRRELQQAGYNGPTNDASIAVAYIRTALSGGWHVAVDAPAGDRLSVDVMPQDLSTASLQLSLSGVTAFAGPAPGGLGQVPAGMSWPLDVASIVLAIVSGLWLAWRFVSARSRAWQLKLGFGMAVGILYGAPRLADWASNANRLAVLSGGDDWLRYEGYARDIRGGSWLMLLGQQPGHAQPFYFQALYPYLLAAGHWMAGESVQAVVLLQIVGVFGAIVLAVLALPATPAAMIGFLVVGATGVLTEWYGLSGYLLSEDALLLFLAALLVCASFIEAKATNRQLALAGLFLGLAVLARSTAWLAAPFVLAIVSHIPGRLITWRRVGIAAAPMLLLAALIPARNWLATGFPAPLPGSFAFNVYQGFVPDGRTITTEPWLTWDKTYNHNLVASAEAVVDAPKDVAGLMLRKAAYVLGFPRVLGAPNVPLVFFPVFLMWVLALVGLLSASHSRLAWIALVFAVSHAVTLVLIFPNNYYYRLLLPSMLPLALWNALSMMQLFQGLPQPSWLGRQLKRLVPR